MLDVKVSFSLCVPTCAADCERHREHGAKQSASLGKSLRTFPKNNKSVVPKRKQAGALDTTMALLSLYWN